MPTKPMFLYLQLQTTLPSQKSISISKSSHEESTDNLIKAKETQQNELQPNTITTQSNKIQYNYNQFNFTEKELEMQKIAEENQKIFLLYQFQFTNSQTIK